MARDVSMCSTVCDTWNRTNSSAPCAAQPRSAGDRCAELSGQGQKRHAENAAQLGLEALYALCARHAVLCAVLSC